MTDKEIAAQERTFVDLTDPRHQDRPDGILFAEASHYYAITPQKIISFHKIVGPAQVRAGPR